MQKRILILASLILTGQAWAQDDVAAKKQVFPRYTVELIVFAYAEDVSVGTEMFIPDTPIITDELSLLTDGEGPLPDDSQPVKEESSVAVDAMLDAKGVEIPIDGPGFVLLPEEEYSLTDIVKRLERLDAYEPFMHVAWTQTTYPKEVTEPILLHAFAAVPNGLDGSFTLYLSRYLHLVVDLALNAERNDASGGMAAIDEQVFSYGDSRLQDDPYATPREGIVRYRLQENRIVKNGELRYFDHPKFGVIAKVTRIELEPAETGQLVSGVGQ